MENNRWTDGLTAELPKAELPKAVASGTPIDKMQLKREGESAEDGEAVRNGARQEVARIANFAIVEKTEPEEEIESDEPREVTVEQANERTQEILQQFKAQYDKLPDKIKVRCTWEDLSDRLFAQEAHYLKLAMDLQNGGELVHVDEEGNPVFRDGGVEPVLKGKSYNDTREILYGKDYEEETPHYGYEMPDNAEELEQIESLTGRPLVANENRDEYRATHMESGKNPFFSRAAYFDPFLGYTCIYDGFPFFNNDAWRGLVRLLRVKKMV